MKKVKFIFNLNYQFIFTPTLVSLLTQKERTQLIPTVLVLP